MSGKVGKVCNSTVLCTGFAMVHEFAVWRRHWSMFCVFQVEMVWVGNTNWIVKFTNQFGQRRNILLDCAVGNQLDRIMQTVGATGIDYLFIGHTHGDHAQGSLVEKETVCSTSSAKEECGE